METKKQPTRKTSEPERAKLTYAQFDALARALAVELMGEQAEAIKLIILLADEIAKHPFDNSHVETIAILIKDHLFAVTPASDEALDRFIDAERRKRKLAA
jgi:hypothetical protein